MPDRRDDDKDTPDGDRRSGHSLLLVPVHLDALWLDADLSVVDAKVDFSRIPYWDGRREVNRDVANISEELLARPFEDRGLQLKKGVHLHWALPQALTRGAIEENGTTFPAVPNRWLVTRSRRIPSGNGEDDYIERQWIVESDYLHPHNASDRSAGVAVPFSAAPSNRGGPPFRYLGRKMSLENWVEDTEPTAGRSHLGNCGFQLTAVGFQARPGTRLLTGQGRGYAEPTFAAFYPNCHSVFGFHDDEALSGMKGVQYDLVGWYSHPEMDDCLRVAKRAHDGGSSWEAFKGALRDGYQWEVAGDAKQDAPLPHRTVCHSRIRFETDTPPTPKLPPKSVTIAVGNTSTEALSAYMDRVAAPELISPLPKPGLIEEQLEALHLSSRLGSLKLDVGPKFKEARHERGFTAVPAGTLWAIRRVSDGIDQSEPADVAGPAALPDALAHALNALNLLQADHDRAGHESESMQTQLFSDWYKYMLCAYPADDARDDYPDLDEVRHFIRKNGLRQLKRHSGKREALKSRLTRLHKETAAAVAAFDPRYVLQARPAPRYWRPHEPVLLIVDHDTPPSKRHGHDGSLQAKGLLECRLQTVDASDIRAQLVELRSRLAGDGANGKHHSKGVHAWTEQPWHPLVLEWQVELYPLGNDTNNLEPDDRDYEAEFITSNYRLAEGAVDLAVKPGKVAVARAASVFTGSSLLTPHAKFQLQKEIEAYLERRGSTMLPVDDPWKKLLDKLGDKDFHALAQSLSGFNDALLMHKQTMQLPIAEPLGSPEAQEFTAAVNAAVGRASRNAPQPNNDFHPLRTGVLKIHELRLVDNFGRLQKLKLKNKKVITTEVMALHANPHLVFLPPRLVQPARLNFRWLAADPGQGLAGDELEMNAHPATTPVCGWLLPNHLDNSLMVCDGTGRALGSISMAKRRWMPVPGGTRVEMERANGPLWKLIRHLLDGAQTESFLGDFFEAIELALDRIDPESHAQHTSLALLLGRPIAVVRAMVDLELRGQPAINQDWTVFRSDIERDLRSEEQGGNELAQRDIDAVAGVRFPIRLGDDRQLNDGLVGYWKEQWSADGKACSFADESFYVHACETAEVKASDAGALADALTHKQKKRLEGLLRQKGSTVSKHDFLHFPHGDALWASLCEQKVLEPASRHSRIRYAADSPDLAQAIGDPPQKLTMLVDPRGVVHATCGILPTKALGIPPDQFAAALEQLAVTFAAGPVLSDGGPKMRVPVPTQPGYAWSWVEKQDESWVENKSLAQPTLEATFSRAQTVREGWLKLTKTRDES